MVENPGLPQGILANNSVTPDVEIEENKTGPASVRNRLRNAKEKSASSKPQYVPVKSSSLKKSMRIGHPTLAETRKTTSSNDVLVSEVAKLSNKIENLEKNTKLLERQQTEQRTFELEKKLSEITDDRLQHLEKLQHEQEQWKQQYLRTIDRLNNPINAPGIDTKPTQQPSYPAKYSVPPNAVYTDKQQLLQTPMPRREIPQPTSSMQPGNGQFLRDILDQCNASTPNVSQTGIPTKTNMPLPHQQPILKSSSYNPIPNPSPIPLKPSASEIMAKEIENDVERQKISEKFPASFSEYLPVSTKSPVSRILMQTVPQSSLVAEFRQKLRKLAEMRSNLENNLTAVQRKQKLDDFAIAAIADRLKKDEIPEFVDERVEMYWIQKLVDDQIAEDKAKAKQEALEAKSKRFTKDSKVTKAVKPKEVKKGKDVKRPKKKKQPAKEEPIAVDNDESVVTHVYGKAEYHPHRSTVHQPFMHTSPLKSPKFRNKRALQTIPVNYVRSEKSQTSSKLSSPTILRSKYLAPTAVSLRPPRIHENDPDPVVVPAAEPVVMVPRPSPRKQPITKPPIEAPKEKKVEIIDPPEELPGNGSMFASSVDEDSSPDAGEVQLEGEGGRLPRQPPKPAPPLPLPQPSPPKEEDLADTVENAAAEDRVKCWVEQEIMARILGQLFPTVSTQQSQTLNMETEALKRIIDDEIRDLIRKKFKKKPEETKPKEAEPVFEPKTPLSTPRSTPSPSVSEESPPPPVVMRSLQTPPSSPQTSIAESEPSVTPPPPPHVPTPPPPEELDVTIVPTPQATPLPSPEASIVDVSVEESAKESVESSRSSIPDPWEGRIPEEDTHLAQPPLASRLPVAPEPAPVDLVVRAITPPPAPPQVLFSSTSKSSSSDDSLRTAEDKTISEGQLLVEHGEMIPKKRQPLLLPGNLEEYMEHANTLKDAADFDMDQASEGEFRPRARGTVIPRRNPNFVVDDPTGVYSRPRKPLNASDSVSDTISVGEVPPGKRNKFYKWKASRSKRNSHVSPTTSKSKPGSPLSVGDLNATSLDSSSISEELGPGVIMVTAATPRVTEAPKVDKSNDRFDGTQSDVVFKDSLDDPMPRPRNQMTLTLPSTEPLSGASDTEDISVQEL